MVTCDPAKFMVYWAAFVPSTGDWILFATVAITDPAELVM
jgi:hypothetical protein